MCQARPTVPTIQELISNATREIEEEIGAIQNIQEHISNTTKEIGRNGNIFNIAILVLLLAIAIILLCMILMGFHFGKKITKVTPL